MAAVIFFDLETTSAYSLGQILNYAFVEVGDDFAPRARCVGEIQISRLELPMPGAIAANRTNVLLHQERAVDNELSALSHIHRFLTDAIARGQGSCTLVGYNSNRFDLGFLRTSFIRNGMDPYFGGKLAYRDLLHLVRKLSSSHPAFPRTLVDGKLSLRLERITQEFSLLEGEQTHSSEDDVLLTVKLARLLSERFGQDIRTYTAYEALPMHRPEMVGKLYWFERPDYEEGSSSRSVLTPMTLLDFDRRYALWVDLHQFSALRNRDAVHWFNPATSMLARASSPPPAGEFADLAREAVTGLSQITLANFFTKSSCDIEQDIYRLDFPGREALAAAIRENSPRALQAMKSVEAKELYRRHRLRSYVWGGPHDARVREELRSYGEERYGGRLLASKLNPTETHPTFAAMEQELVQIASQGERESQLMAALRGFYERSDLCRVGAIHFAPIAPSAAA